MLELKKAGSWHAPQRRPAATQHPRGAGGGAREGGAPPLKGLGRPKWISRDAPQSPPNTPPPKKSIFLASANIGKQSSCPLLSRPSGPAHLDRRGDPLGDCDHACFAAATSERATSSRYAIGRRRQRTARLEEASRTAAPSRGAIKSDPSMIDLRSRYGPSLAEGWSPSARIHLLLWGTEWRKRRV